MIRLRRFHRRPEGVDRELPPLWVFVAAPFVAVSLVVFGWYGLRLINQTDSQAHRLARQNVTINDLVHNQRQLLSLVQAQGDQIDRLTEQLNRRASNAQHVLCINELILELTGPLGVAVVHPTEESEAAFLGALAHLRAGLDPDTGICPPLPT